jgi:hypothetical protein
MTQTQLRGFAAITPDCLEHLKKLGVTNKNIVFNPTYSSEDLLLINVELLSFTNMPCNQSILALLIQRSTTPPSLRLVLCLLPQASELADLPRIRESWRTR